MGSRYAEHNFREFVVLCFWNMVSRSARPHFNTILGTERSRTATLSARGQTKNRALAWPRQLGNRLRRYQAPDTRLASTKKLELCTYSKTCRPHPACLRPGSRVPNAHNWALCIMAGNRPRAASLFMKHRRPSLRLFVRLKVAGDPPTRRHRVGS